MVSRASLSLCIDYRVRRDSVLIYSWSYTDNHLSLDGDRIQGTHS